MYIAVEDQRKITGNNYSEVPNILPCVNSGIFDVLIFINNLAIDTKS